MVVHIMCTSVSPTNLPSSEELGIVKKCGVRFSSRSRVPLAIGEYLLFRALENFYIVQRASVVINHLFIDLCEFLLETARVISLLISFCLPSQQLWIARKLYKPFKTQRDSTESWLT